MTAEENFDLTQVAYINEMFPLSIAPENMPMSFYIEELKGAITKLTTLMISLDLNDRQIATEVLLTVAGTHKMLSDMKQDVLLYSQGYSR